MRYLKVIQILLVAGLCSLTVSTAYGDFNWPYGPPLGSSGPGGGGSGGCGNSCPGPKPDERPKGDPDKDCGSIIGCENQTLGEVINVTGMPLRLHYQSDRVPGRRATRIMKIRLSGPTLPPGLQRIHLEIAIAGQALVSSFAPQPDLVDTFTWDGKDAYGRTLQGQQPVKVRIGYEYIAQYYTTADSLAASYNRFGTSPISVGPSGGAVVFTSDGTRTTAPPVILWQDYQASVGSPVSPGLGGWSLSVHHSYDGRNQTLYLGNGDQRSATALGRVIITAAGTGDFFSGDGGPAILAGLDRPHGVAVGPDGSLYIATNDHRIRRVGPDGIITTVVGTGNFGFSGDGGPATGARLSSPEHIAIASDGSLYIADHLNNRIRRVGPDGIITTVAGSGVFGVAGDGGPATQAQLTFPIGVAVGSDGSFYFSENANPVVRRVGPDGTITTFAGTGINGFAGDGGFATNAPLSHPGGLALGSDGSLYIADTNNNSVRRVGTDGIITTVAGTGPAGFGFAGDGGPASQAKLNGPAGVAVASDGNLYIADNFNNRIRKVGPDGIITTVAGTGFAGFAGDGGLATQAWLNLPVPSGVAAGSDGSLYIADGANLRVRHLRSPLPTFSVDDVLVAAADGGELYDFSSTGRHLRTLDALTGAVRFQFAYDGGGRLASITDGDGNVTAIVRDGSGNPTAIVAPFGQQTTLTVNGDGYLASVTNPAGDAVQLTYNAGSAMGLLATLTDPRGNVHNYTYDALGRLLRDENPGGGVKVLARTDITDLHYSVTVTTASGLVTVHEVENLPTGDTRRVLIEPSGARTETLILANGSRQVTYPDGTVTNLVEGPDPRFGMQAPIVKSQTVTTPGGRTQITTRTRSVTLSSPSDVLSLSALADTLTIDGRTTTTNYDAATRTLTLQTPASRTAAAILDTHGLMTQTQMTGLEPTSFGYTSNGRVSTVTEGTGGTARTTTLTYGSTGPGAAYLERIDDALGRQTNFAYDAAGRTTQQTLPGGRIVAFGFDANSNITSLTPPGRAAHTVTYTADQQIASYTPPAIVGGGTPIVYSYDTDRRPVQIKQADGQNVDLTYDASGRPIKLTQAGRIIDITYQGTSTNIQGIAGPAGQQLSYGLDGPMQISQTWSGPIAGSVSRTLDNGLRTATRTVNAAAISMNYDLDSQLTGAGALTLTRHPNHGLVSATSLGGVTDTLTYSGFGGLDHYTARYSGTAFFDVQYTRDALGRITNRTETLGGITDIYTYGYDAAGRLANVQKNSATTHTYSYDANGNRLTANAVAASFDGQDRQTQAGTTAFAYSQNGERQTTTAPGGTTIYSYDAIGNLLNVSLPGGTQVDYLLDGLSRRIGKKVNATLVQGWLYDERGRIVGDLDGTGAVMSRFVYASRRSVPDYIVRSGATYRLVSDHLGSVRLVVKADDGTIAQRLDYDPFGSVTNDTAPGFQPFGFAGGLYDRDTILVRFGARDYDAETGRWTTKDPIFFAGGDTNLYAYVANDPVNRHDSNGLDGPGDGGVCYGPPPPPFDQRLGNPFFLDPKLLPPPGSAKSSGGSSGGGGSGGGLNLGPFTFKPNLNWPSIGDLRDWNPGVCSTASASSWTRRSIRTSRFPPHRRIPGPRPERAEPEAAGSAMQQGTLA